MKKIIFMLAIFMISCGTFQFDGHNVAHVNVLNEKTGTNYDVACTGDIEYKSGQRLITDDSCVFFLEIPGEGTFKCSVAFGTDGKPITENTTLKESCDIDIKK